MNEIQVASKYMYNGGDLKAKEDFETRLHELRAYYEMDGEDFDFGNGLIKNEFSMGFEFHYYKQDIRILEYILENWNKEKEVNNFDDMTIDEREMCIEYWNPPIKHNKMQRENKYAKNRQHKDKMKEMAECSWFPIYIYKEYPKREYRSKKSNHLKRQSNKQIRKYKKGLPKKGNGFHKVFDFWWELY